MSVDTFKLYQDAFVMGAVMQRGNFEPAAHLMTSILTRLGVRSNIDVKAIFSPPNPGGNVISIFQKAGYGNLTGIINSGFTSSRIGNTALIMAIIEQEEPRHDLQQMLEVLSTDLQSPQIAITINWFFQYPIKDHLLRERDAIVKELKILLTQDSPKKKAISKLGFRVMAFASIILESINIGIFLSPENLINDIVKRVETRARISSMVRIGIIPAALVLLTAVVIPFLPAELLLSTNLITESTLSYIAIIFGSFLLPITKILYDRSSYHRIVTEVGNLITHLGFEQIFRDTFNQIREQGKTAEVAAATAHAIGNEFLINFLIGKETKYTPKQLEEMRKMLIMQNEQRIRLTQAKTEPT
ncbi:MAG: hypothetical protein EAX86_12470 [Candidatus Heimdallarchaeota archaeon]|nr:hypothetical protein [Candidatus Heimdallarchaeota archaeon]